MSERRFIQRHFASDNYSGICPEAWAAMAEANAGHQVSYGNDDWTQRAADPYREVGTTEDGVLHTIVSDVVHLTMEQVGASK